MTWNELVSTFQKTVLAATAKTGNFLQPLHQYGGQLFVILRSTAGTYVHSPDIMQIMAVNGVVINSQIPAAPTELMTAHYLDKYDALGLFIQNDAASADIIDNICTRVSPQVGFDVNYCTNWHAYAPAPPIPIGETRYMGKPFEINNAVYDRQYLYSPHVYNSLQIGLTNPGPVPLTATVNATLLGRMLMR